MAKMKLSRVQQLLDEHDKREEQSPHGYALVNFRREIEAAIPGCRTTVRNGNWAWVYMPDDHYAMGAVGYGDFSRNGRGGSTYAVRSRTIVNGKYSDGSDQHRMLMSSNSSVAVKNAKKYLRRLSPQDLVQQTHEHLREAIGTMRSNARNVLMEKEAKLFGANLHGRSRAPILTELKHLVMSGHTFLDPSMPERLTEYFALYAENDDTQQPCSMLFVAVSRSGDKQRFDIVPVDKAENHWPQVGEPETFYDDVPEHVLGRLAVLSMVETGTFVPGVGFKHTEGLFYVAR
jgi:hypothetical protein